MITLASKKFSLLQIVCLVAYYGFARHLPRSYSMWGGKYAKNIRYHICRHIFKSCGKEVNIEKNAMFGSGIDIVIGDYSDLGINCNVPSNIIIGNNVMMAPNCHVFAQNHETSDISIPMNRQGFTERKQTIIDDDVWIGQNVTILPGRHIYKGSIIGACCLLCKDFPPYSVVGGNPSKLLKSRINSQ